MQNLKTKWCLPKLEQHGLSVKDVKKPKYAVTDCIDYIQVIRSIPDKNEEATRDSLVANALALDLIREGNGPRELVCFMRLLTGFPLTATLSIKKKSETQLQSGSKTTTSQMVKSIYLSLCTEWVGRII